MKTESFTIKTADSEVRLDTYILDETHMAKPPVRPFVLVLPGGGYLETVGREGEPIAASMLGMGFNTAVLWYSVKPAVFPTALEETARAVALIREHAKEWNVGKVFVTGYSAGGHLAASIGVLWDREYLRARLGFENEKARPDGVILAYPVITAGEYRHDGSIRNLLGERYGDPAAHEQVSLELQVTPSAAPAFVWTTFTDEVVPVENSLMLASAYAKNKVSLELHVFPRGTHGLSRGDAETLVPGTESIPEMRCWMEMAGRWVRQRQDM